MADKSFYIPGLSKENMEQWNKVAPSLRILVREDLFPLDDCLHLTGLAPPSRGYLFPEVPQHMQQMQQGAMMGMGLPMVGMTMGHNSGHWSGRMPY